MKFFDSVSNIPYFFVVFVSSQVDSTHRVVQHACSQSLYHRSRCSLALMQAMKDKSLENKSNITYLQMLLHDQKHTQENKKYA